MAPRVNLARADHFFLKTSTAFQASSGGSASYSRARSKIHLGQMIVRIEFEKTREQNLGSR